MFCLLPVGGPSVSVAVKRSAYHTDVNDIKRPALESVTRVAAQVLLPIYLAFVNPCLLSHYFLMSAVDDAVMCAFLWRSIK